MAYVYRHIRLDKNEPFYIGRGSDDKGKYTRAFSKKNRNKRWWNTISLAGYRIDILLDNLTWDEACDKEIEFIKLYGRSDLKKGTLCNLTDGGEGSLGNSIIPNAKTRLKMSLKKKGVKFSKQHKERLTNALIGNNRWKGKKHKEETKKKTSESIKLWHKKRKELGLKNNNTLDGKIKKSESMKLWHKKMRELKLHVHSDEDKSKKSEFMKLFNNKNKEFKKNIK